MAELVLQQATVERGEGEGLYDCSINVAAGQSFGLMGPSGAGKSIAVALLMGFLQPDAGECSIRGLPCFAKRHQIQQYVGFVPRHPTLPRHLTGDQFLALMRRLRRQVDQKKVQGLMDQLDIHPMGLCGRMPEATRQKLSILAALMHDPPILILDDPSACFDAMTRNALMDILLKERQAGKTIFLASHLLDETQKLCDTIAIIRRGRLAAVQSAQALSYTRQRVYHITFATPQDAQNFAQEWESAVEVIGSRALVAVPASPQALVRTLAKYPLRDLTGGRESLEESFLRYYGDDAV